MKNTWASKTNHPSSQRRPGTSSCQTWSCKCLRRGPCTAFAFRGLRSTTCIGRECGPRRATGQKKHTLQGWKKRTTWCWKRQLVWICYTAKLAAKSSKNTEWVSPWPLSKGLFQLRLGSSRGWTSRSCSNTQRLNRGLLRRLKPFLRAVVSRNVSWARGSSADGPFPRGTKLNSRRLEQSRWLRL